MLHRSAPTRSRARAAFSSRVALVPEALPILPAYSKMTRETRASSVTGSQCTAKLKLGDKKSGSGLELEARMKFTTFGKTGITVSRLCLGCMTYGGGDLPDWALGTKGWHVNKEDAREHFAIALEAGINFFDTADVYSAGLSEEITGQYLNEMASRDEIIVATKVCGQMGFSPNKKGLSRKHIIEGCDNSLRRLGMDFIDLYQIHRWDFNTPIEETLEALDSLVRAGKVRYLGD